MAFSTFKHSVWKLHGRQKPRHCPCCGAKHSLHYVGFALNYEPGLQAHLFVCNGCDIWVDCIWPRDLSYLFSSRPRSIMPSIKALPVAVAV